MDQGFFENNDRLLREHAAKPMREKINAIIEDLVSDFVAYDRREDDFVPEGAIEDAIRNGEITMDDIVQMFRKELNAFLEWSM